MLYYYKALQHCEFSPLPLDLSWQIIFLLSSWESRRKKKIILRNSGRDENIDWNKLFMMGIFFDLIIIFHFILQTNKNWNWPCDIESDSGSTCLQSCSLCSPYTDTIWTAKYNFWSEFSSFKNMWKFSLNYICVITVVNWFFNSLFRENFLIESLAY